VPSFEPLLLSHFQPLGVDFHSYAETNMIVQACPIVGALMHCVPWDTKVDRLTRLASASSAVS
jgi:hypothetical protein